MERSNVPAVINTCKSLASAYHSSINFSKAVHVAQIQVLHLLQVIWPEIIMLLRFSNGLSTLCHGLWLSQSPPDGILSTSV